jgi:hypothetical protein
MSDELDLVRAILAMGDGRDGPMLEVPVRHLTQQPWKGSRHV